MSPLGSDSPDKHYGVSQALGEVPRGGAATDRSRGTAARGELHKWSYLFVPCFAGEETKLSGSKLSENHLLDGAAAQAIVKRVTKAPTKERLELLSTASYRHALFSYAWRELVIISDIARPPGWSEMSPPQRDAVDEDASWELDGIIQCSPFICTAIRTALRLAGVDIGDFLTVDQRRAWDLARCATDENLFALSRAEASIGESTIVESMDLPPLPTGESSKKTRARAALTTLNPKRRPRVVRVSGYDPEALDAKEPFHRRADHRHPEGSRGGHADCRPRA